jgi:hypothetical protein
MHKVLIQLCARGRGSTRQRGAQNNRVILFIKNVQVRYHQYFIKKICTWQHDTIASCEIV